MVPLSERDAVTQRAKADTEMRAVYAFLFDEPFDFTSETAFPHADLLRAVASGDTDAFTREVASYQKRRTSESSGWYENDSLVFLLLVGCERFGVATQFLDPILTARERNTNPIPKQVNEVFRALTRKDHGMDSPFSFIKLPLLHLAGQLDLSSEAALKVYRELTQAGNIGQLSPFLQLLALRAYDLVLSERRPHPFENFDALVKALESYREHTSPRQAFNLLWALPYKWWIGLISLVALALSFTFGLGQRASESVASRQRPAGLQALVHVDATNHELPAVRGLARQFLSSGPTNEPCLAVAVQTSHLRITAGKFSLEASTSVGTVLGAQAWLIHPTEGGVVQSLLPTQHGPRAARAFAASGDADDYLIMVLFVQPSQTMTADQVAATIVLRTLD
jgi:hypothetical protein